MSHLLDAPRWRVMNLRCCQTTSERSVFGCPSRFPVSHRLDVLDERVTEGAHPHLVLKTLDHGSGLSRRPRSGATDYFSLRTWEAPIFSLRYLTPLRYPLPLGCKFPSSPTDAGGPNAFVPSSSVLPEESESQADMILSFCMRALEMWSTCWVLSRAPCSVDLSPGASKEIPSNLKYPMVVPLVLRQSSPTPSTSPRVLGEAVLLKWLVRLEIHFQPSTLLLFLGARRQRRRCPTKIHTHITNPASKLTTPIIPCRTSIRTRTHRPTTM